MEEDQYPRRYCTATIQLGFIVLEVAPSINPAGLRAVDVVDGLLTKLLWNVRGVEIGSDDSLILTTRRCSKILEAFVIHCNN